MKIEHVVQLLLWLYRQTCASWWSLEPFVLCFQESGWDGLQQVIHRPPAEIWTYSRRYCEFPDARRVALEESVEVLRDLLWNASWSEIAVEWEKSQANGERILDILDPAYPEALRQLEDPPAILWCSREVSAAWWERCLAVVGSRRSSVYGEKATRAIVEPLVRDFGMTIVSGCATGIDSVAHQTCLQSGGVTVGVLGVELAHAPYRVRRLFSHENAVLLSEWPPGFGGEGWNFARRNRLISGLAQGVLVVEAQARSGTMLTVSSALEQGKEVFVVPHSIWSKNAAGVTKLANNGAKVVLSAAEIVGDLEESSAGQFVAEQHSREEEQLLDILRHAEGEMALADLALARPDTISSSQWWQVLQALTQKGAVKNSLGVISIE